MRYTVPEARHVLSIGTTRIYELFKSGQLESMTDGRRRYVSARALDAYMERIASENALKQLPQSKR
ncbi:helix-turn-helix domain-containing protein [Methylobacterium sp. Leaf85]|uniref:helix-turn-helix domain-containing protein n=1 Tax=Methylobacterium sp. Leaf85 TaxID=1736241 RepID=UPI0012E85F10